MKLPLLVFMLVLLMNPFAHAQETPKRKSMICKAIIKDIYSRTTRGYLVNFSDSCFILSKTKKLFSSSTVSDSSLETISYSEMQKVELRTGGAGKEILIPAGVGLALGAATGFAMGSDNNNDLLASSAGEKALILGAMGFGLGAVVGAVLSHPSLRTYSIEGNRQKFNEMKLAFLSGIARN